MHTTGVHRHELQRGTFSPLQWQTNEILGSWRVNRNAIFLTATCNVRVLSYGRRARRNPSFFIEPLREKRPRLTLSGYLLCHLDFWLHKERHVRG